MKFDYEFVSVLFFRDEVRGGKVGLTENDLLPTWCAYIVLNNKQRG